MEATTIHGFYYLHRRNSFLARFFWAGIIVLGFSAAGYLIYNSMLDWEDNQTITTLESIANPIQDVHFPTVTVCPHEKNVPDNWSFLEKLLNAADPNTNIGAKYLGFFSSRSLKTRENYISFAQFVYFFRELCLLFNF